MSVILIAGGSGLLGSKIQQVLLSAGHEVRVLSRNPKRQEEYRWNPDKKEIDFAALDKIDVLINLCGEGIADKRWSAKRKKALHDSRIKTTQFLYTYLDQMPQLKTYISASGITCYGFDEKKVPYSETDPFGKDYISSLVQEWEEAADLFQKQCRVVKMRISIVLTKEGGALPKLTKPIMLGFGSALGNGRQIMPWVHIDDLANAFCFVVEQDLNGAYNLVSGNTTNLEITQAIADQLNKKLWLPNVPGFVLRLILGEMSTILLQGVACSNQKLLETGFEFKTSELKKAIL